MDVPNKAHSLLQLIRTYYLFSFFQDFALVYPVYAIFFQERGLDYARISALLAIWSTAVLLAEIPSGILADRWSRKWVLFVGMLFKASGFLVWLVRPDFAGFAAGFTLWGVQEALCSGTTEAFLYDALKQHTASDRFVRITGRGGAIARVGIVLSLLLGALVYSRSATAVLVASAVSMAGAGGLVTMFPDVRSGHRPGAPSTPLVQHLRTAVRVPGLASLVLFGSLATVVYGVLDEYDPLLARHVGVPVALIGIWGTVRFAAEALGAGFAATISSTFRLDSPRRLAVWLCTGSVALFLSVFHLRAATLPLYFLYYLIMASAEVRMQGWIHDRIASEGRATIGSVVSFVYEALGILLLLAAIPVAAGHGLSAVFLGGSLVSGCAAIALFAGTTRRSTATGPDSAL